MLTLNTPGVFISPPLKGRGRGGVCNLLFFKTYSPHPIPSPSRGGEMRTALLLTFHFLK